MARRSTRERKKSTSFYDEAKEQLLSKRSSQESSRSSSRRSQSTQEENNDSDDSDYDKKRPTKQQRRQKKKSSKKKEVVEKHEESDDDEVEQEEQDEEQEGLSGKDDESEKVETENDDSAKDPESDTDNNENSDAKNSNSSGSSDSDKDRDSSNSDDESSMGDYGKPDAAEEYEEIIEQEKLESESDDEDYEEEYNPNEAHKKATSPRKSITKSPKKTPKKSPQSAAKESRVVQQVRLAYNSSAATANNNKASTKGRGIFKAPNRRAAATALSSLSKKVLDEAETAGSSLLASLLMSFKPNEDSDVSANDRRLPRDLKSSIYAPQLFIICKQLTEQLQSDANKAHVKLFNLLFRSVGGSVETNLPLSTDLEDLSEEQSEDIVTAVATAMCEMDVDQVLITASPESAGSSNARSLGKREYRRIYLEFWYLLGHTILSSPVTSAGGGAGKTDSGQNENDNDDDKNEAYSSLFEVELLRDLVTRMSELAPVGQPDIRAASVMAIYSLAHAALDRTISLEAKIQVANRQYQAAGKANKTKRETLRHQLDSWNRHQAELVEIVEGPVMQGVFIHRYRDSNSHIRALSLETLSKMTLQRPDLFLKDKYLKYLGWMCSDKEAVVRVASLSGLLAPFIRAKAQDEEAPDTPANKLIKSSRTFRIGLSSMENVCKKFLNRFVDCTCDSQSLLVQEKAMSLLLTMLRAELLDDWDDDKGWEKVNLKAIDANTSAQVRRDALYFILDQLDSFDGDQVSSKGLPDKNQIERVQGIASWIGHSLCDGDIHINKLRIKLTDYVVQSLREMPEHKILVTNWSVLLKAIRSDNPQQGRNAGRHDVAKLRVLLRMFACATQLEVAGGSSNSSSGGGGINDTKSQGRRRNRTSQPSTEQQLHSLSIALLKSLPELLVNFQSDSIALRSLTSLPKFLIPSVFSISARKGDVQSLLKTMSRIFFNSTDETVMYNIAHAFSVLVQGEHARVRDVQAELHKIALTLQERLMELFRDGDSSQIGKEQESSSAPPTKKRRSTRLSDVSLSQDSSTADDGASDSRALDIEHSICLCLRRWRILSKRCDVNMLFQEKNDEEEREAEFFCNTIAEAMAKRLQDRKPKEDPTNAPEMEGDVPPLIAPEAWEKVDQKIHTVVAESVDESLVLLLHILAWKLHHALAATKSSNQAQKKDNEGGNETGNDDADGDSDNSSKNKDGIEDSVHLVAHMRDRLVRLVGLCFDLFIGDEDDGTFSEDQKEFSSAVQKSAGRVASDLRTLFPKEWVSAADSTRRALALSNDSQLVGGFARYFQSRGTELRELAGVKDKRLEEPLVGELLLPPARALAANWNTGNRREAGMLLSHIAGSGNEATQAMLATARILKKINPARFLEAQMACLRLSFEDWVNNEPDELETDRPTEEEMNKFEEAEKKHHEMFLAIEQQAAKLSMTLGVGKIHNMSLSRALLCFIQEGIRFAFSTGDGEEDDLVLGSRLPFLLVLCKYASRIKKNRAQIKELKQSLDEKEAELRAHAEFDEVHEDDLAALASFREALGIKVRRRSSSRSVSTPQSIPDDDDDASVVSFVGSVGETPSPLGRSTRSRSKLLSVGSKRSRRSTQTSLSPLYEEDASMGEEEDDHDDDDGNNDNDKESNNDEDSVDLTPRKKRRVLSASQSRRGSSFASSVTMSTMGRPQETINEEGSSAEDMSDGE